MATFYLSLEKSKYKIPVNILPVAVLWASDLIERAVTHNKRSDVDVGYCHFHGPKVEWSIDFTKRGSAWDIVREVRSVRERERERERERRRKRDRERRKLSRQKHWNWRWVCTFSSQSFHFRPRRVFSLFLVTRAHWFFPTLEEKKTHEKNTKCNVLHSRAFRYRARFVTHYVAFVFLCLWLPAETAVVQDLCLGNTKIEIFRGKWGFFLHILLNKLALDWCNIEMPNNATLAWWLIMRTSS